MSLSRIELAQKNHTCANHGQLVPHPDPERWLCLQPVKLRLPIHARQRVVLKDVLVAQSRMRTARLKC